MSLALNHAAVCRCLHSANAMGNGFLHCHERRRDGLGWNFDGERSGKGEVCHIAGKSHTSKIGGPATGVE